MAIAGLASRAASISGRTHNNPGELVASIGFFPLFDVKSHVNATFGIAKALKRRGHRVTYIASLDFEEHIRAQGFEFRPFCPDLFPKGFVALKAAAPAAWKSTRRKLVDALLNGELDETIGGSQLDLLLVDSHIQAVALVANKVGIPTALLSPTLPRARNSAVPPLTHAVIPNSFLSRLKIRFLWYRYDLYRAARSLASVLFNLQTGRIKQMADATGYPREHIDMTGMAPVLTLIPELILCPQAFDFPRPRDKYHHIHYIGAFVDLERKDDTRFPWDRLREDKRLLYCALGTVAYGFDGAREFLQMVIDAVATKPGWQLVISIGEHLDVRDFRATSPDVVIVNDAPQIELLRRASIMINHGGLNSVKESIMCGVPMIIFPWHGKPVNAIRVVYHGMGLMGDVKRVDTGKIRSMIDRIERDPSFKTNTELMRQRFVETEKSSIDVQLIEQLVESARVGKHAPHEESSGYHRLLPLG